MVEDRAWKVLSQATLVDKHWLTLRQQHVRLPNGHEIEEFFHIEGPDWAAVLALTEESQLVLVRQYRHGIGQMSLELPAGVIDAGESGLQAAQRELLEETGYAAESWHALRIVATEPARHTTRAHLFVALGARCVAPARPESSELIELELMDLAAIAAAIDRGAIVHGIHVAAILLAAQRGFLALS